MMEYHPIMDEFSFRNFGHNARVTIKLPVFSYIRYYGELIWGQLHLWLTDKYGWKLGWNAVNVSPISVTPALGGSKQRPVWTRQRETRSYAIQSPYL